jgi:hypothetical protein
LTRIAGRSTLKVESGSFDSDVNVVFLVGPPGLAGGDNIEPDHDEGGLIREK